jgi:hypothetical protein
MFTTSDDPQPEQAVWYRVSGIGHWFRLPDHFGSFPVAEAFAIKTALKQVGHPYAQTLILPVGESPGDPLGNHPMHRVGVTFTPEQKERIRELVTERLEAGDVVAAQGASSTIYWNANASAASSVPSRLICRSCGGENGHSLDCPSRGGAWPR